MRSTVTGHDVAQLRNRLIGNRRGKIPIKESPLPLNVRRLTAANSWLKFIAKKMVKRALKGTGTVILAKEEDYALFSDGYFLAVVDGTFLDFLFELKGSNTPPMTSDNRSIKEYFDAIRVGDAFRWSTDNSRIIQEGSPSPRSIVANSTKDPQVMLAMSVFGFVRDSMEGPGAYTTESFMHVIIPPQNKLDPRFLVSADPSETMYIQRNMVKVFGSDYGELKYTIYEDAVKKMGRIETQLPVCVWSQGDEFMGVVSRFSADLRVSEQYENWQTHLR